MILHGCVSLNGDEIDGKEFECSDLKELTDILKSNKQVHLNFIIDGKEDIDLDLWLDRLD